MRADSIIGPDSHKEEVEEEKRNYHLGFISSRFFSLFFLIQNFLCPAFSIIESRGRGGGLAVAAKERERKKTRV